MTKETALGNIERQLREEMARDWTSKVRAMRSTYAEDMNKGVCSTPGCDHGSHDTGLVMTARCHPDASVLVVYLADQGAAVVKCSVCDEIVTKMAVASEVERRQASALMRIAQKARASGYNEEELKEAIGVALGETAEQERMAEREAGDNISQLGQFQMAAEAVQSLLGHVKAIRYDIEKAGRCELTDDVAEELQGLVETIHPLVEKPGLFYHAARATQIRIPDQDDAAAQHQFHTQIVDRTFPYVRHYLLNAMQRPGNPHVNLLKSLEMDPDSYVNLLCMGYDLMMSGYADASAYYVAMVTADMDFEQHHHNGLLCAAISAWYVGFRSSELSLGKPTPDPQAVDAAMSEVFEVMRNRIMEAAAAHQAGGQLGWIDSMPGPPGGHQA